MNAVRTERPRRFGEVWLGLELLEKFSFKDFFQAHLTGARENFLGRSRNRVGGRALL